LVLTVMWICSTIASVVFKEVEILNGAFQLTFLMCLGWGVLKMMEVI